MNKIISHNQVTILNIASTVILQGLAFFTAPVFSGILGTANYGVASVYLTWTSLASTVFSLQAAGTVAQAKIYFPEEEQARYQSGVLSLAALSYIIFSVLTILILYPLSGRFGVRMPMVILALLQGWGMYCAGFMNLKFTYEFQAGKNFILSLLVSVSTIAASLFFISRFPAEENYWGRILGQSVPYTIIGVIVFLWIHGRGKLFYHKSYWLFTLPIAVPTVFHLLAHIVLNQSDRVMLKYMSGDSATGIYSLAATFSSVLNTLYSALNNSWVPFYYRYTREGRVEKIRRHARNYIELFTVLTMGFMLLSREVFHIFAPESYRDGTDYIPLFALGCYFVFLYSFPVNYEFYHKQTRTIAIVTMSAAVCNIILNFLWIPWLGPVGAVLATMTAHGLQFLFHDISAKKIRPGEFPFQIRDFLPGLCTASCTCLFVFLTAGYWPVRWTLAVILGAYQLIRIIRRKEIF